MHIAGWARSLENDPEVLAFPGIPAALPAPGSPEKATADRLRELARLRNEGLITEGEYEVKQRELLGGCRTARRGLRWGRFRGARRPAVTIYTRPQ